MSVELSRLEQAYNLLRVDGRQFTGHPEIPLEGLTFNHDNDGPTAITIDEEVLLAQGAVYAGDSPLRDALWFKYVETSSLQDATEVLQGALNEDELVWGFSGFATGGINPATGKPFNYEVEAEGLSMLYDHLIQQGRQPNLVVDGGLSEGTVGLNGVIAQLREVPTMGFIPKQGLASVGIRDHLVVWGETYEQRLALLGSAPDALVCVGGMKDTITGCYTALCNGAAVLLLALRDDYPVGSLANIYQKSEGLAAAVGAGRMVVCTSLNDIPESVDLILQQNVRNTRDIRERIVTNLLAAA